MREGRRVLALLLIVVLAVSSLTTGAAAAADTQVKVYWADDMNNHQGSNGDIKKESFGKLTQYDEVIGMFFQDSDTDISVNRINGLDNQGGGWAGYVERAITTEKAGSYPVSFLCYGDGNRSYEITVNGASQGNTATVAEASQTYTAKNALVVLQKNLELNKGENVIHLQAPSGDIAPNFVAMAIQECSSSVEPEVPEITHPVVPGGENMSIAYSSTYKDPIYTNPKEEQKWRDGLVTGNGENGLIESQNPLDDVLIYQHIKYSFPSDKHHQTPVLSTGMEKAKQQLVENKRSSANNTIIATANNWVKETYGSGRWDIEGTYSFHPGHQLRMKEVTDGNRADDYIRFTNYDTAEIGAIWTDKNGTQWERTSFSSREDNVTYTYLRPIQGEGKINMDISIDDIADMANEGQQDGSVGDAAYRKIAAEDGSYLAQVLHYPDYQYSSLKNGGATGVTRIYATGENASREYVFGTDTAVDNHAKDRESNGKVANEEKINVGSDKQPKVAVREADSILLVTKSSRSKDDMGTMEEFKKASDAEVIEKACVQKLLNDTQSAYEKNQENGVFDYDKAVEKHAVLHQEMFNRVQFDLNASEADRALTNEELLAKQKSDKSTMNLALAERAFQNGRYANVCCSGYQVPRLGGMWTGAWHVEWSGDYTTDANINLQVAGSNIGNMKESIEGLLNMELRISSDMMMNAYRIYGIENALMAPPRTNGDSGELFHFINSFPGEVWNAGASWLLLPVYEYWKCFGNQNIPLVDDIEAALRECQTIRESNEYVPCGTGDSYKEKQDLQEILDLTDERVKQILNQGYFDLEKDLLNPLLTKQANLWTGLMSAEYYMDKDGNPKYEAGKTQLEEGETYLILPSFSPENWPGDSQNCCVTINAAMDVAAARDGMNMAASMEQAAKGSQANKDLIAAWEDYISKLPDYQYEAETGEVKEWMMKDYPENHGHRHISHLYGIWPGFEGEYDTELVEGSKLAIQMRAKAAKDGVAGHSWMHKGLVQARLKNSDGVSDILNGTLSSNVFYTSMMTAHNLGSGGTGPTAQGLQAYCTDTSITLPAIMLESLAYSDTGVIEFLPAMPKEWENGGSVSGMVARTRASIDSLTWDEAGMEAVITNTDDKAQKIKCKLAKTWSKVLVNEKELEVKTDETGDPYVTVSLNKGENATIAFTFAELENGSYIIVKDGKQLSTKDNSFKEDAALALGTKDVVWNLQVVDGTKQLYRLVNAETGRELTISDDKVTVTRNGSILVMRDGKIMSQDGTKALKESNGTFVLADASEGTVFQWTKQNTVDTAYTADSIAIDSEADTITMTEGETKAFAATVVPKKAEQKGIVWTIVDENGKADKNITVKDGKVTAGYECAGNVYYLQAKAKDSGLASNVITIKVKKASVQNITVGKNTYIACWGAAGTGGSGSDHSTNQAEGSNKNHLGIQKNGTRDIKDAFAEFDLSQADTSREIEKISVVLTCETGYSKEQEVTVYAADASKVMYTTESGATAQWNEKMTWDSAVDAMNLDRSDKSAVGKTTISNPAQGDRITLDVTAHALKALNSDDKKLNLRFFSNSADRLFVYSGREANTEVRPYVIVAYKEEEAEEPARIKGDVNGDEKVTAVDALLALRHVVGKLTLSDVQFKAADMDGDNGITVVDVQAILDKAVGKDTFIQKREQQNFNADWKFVLGDAKGAQETAYDDSLWGDVALPHSFSIPYDLNQNSFYVGYGWYRKNFIADESMRGKRINIEFEGVFQVCTIYVNGQKAAYHEGGYSGFNVDITDYVNFDNGGNNVIAIQVDNNWRPDLAPRGGDHQFSGGIYRDVYLTVTEPVHVDWYGTYVWTPALCNPKYQEGGGTVNILDSYVSEEELAENLAKKQSDVQVITEITNDSDKEVSVYVKQEVSDANDNVVAVFQSDAQVIGAGAQEDILAQSEMIQKIKLWSMKNPNLYKVKTSVYADETLTDTYETEFGFRSAQFTTDGFFLNGEKVMLDGVNVHQDHGGWCDAVTDNGFYRDVKMVKEAGFNFIRGSHYPHDPAFADACDELGLAFWCEGGQWSIGGYQSNDDVSGTIADWTHSAYPEDEKYAAKFEQSCMDMLEAMIRVNRNHPSVVVWSMGNEAFFTSDATKEKSKQLVNKMRNLAHKLDPTRKAGMGGTQRNGYNDISVCDVAGGNGDGAKAQYTNYKLPHLVAEYASTSAERNNATADLKWGEIQHGSGNDITVNGNKIKQYTQYDKNGYLDEKGQGVYLPTGSSGMSLWCMFHHGSVGGKSLRIMGIADYYRLPLKSWYTYREVNTGVPREDSVDGTASKIDVKANYTYDGQTTLGNDGKDDAQIVVTLLNDKNQWVNDSTEIKLEVVDGPGVFPGGKTYTMLDGKTFMDGKGAIEFRSYYAGTTTIRVSAPKRDDLEDVEIRIVTEDTLGSHQADQEPEDFMGAMVKIDESDKIADPQAYGQEDAASNRQTGQTSSSSEGHAPLLAVDGDPDTYWEAGKDGSGEYWEIFLENTYDAYKMKLDFGEQEYPYKIETKAADNDEWKLLCEYKTAEEVKNRPAEENMEGRTTLNVRVTFTDVPDGERPRIYTCNIYGVAHKTHAYQVNSQYVSDLEYVSMKSGWNQDKFKKDTTLEGNPIRVGGTEYKKGIAIHADSEIVYNLDGKYSRFQAIIGIDDEVKDKTTADAYYQVYATYTDEISGEEKEVQILNELIEADQVKKVDLSVDQVTKLRLVTDKVSRNSNDHTDWADARLLGALRDISKDSRATVTVSTNRVAPEAGKDFEATFRLKNKTTGTLEWKPVLEIYDKNGTLVETVTETQSNAKGSTDFVTLTYSVSEGKDYYAVLSVQDGSGTSLTQKIVCE